jgi:hypothetical protein
MVVHLTPDSILTNRFSSQIGCCGGGGGAALHQNAIALTSHIVHGCGLSLFQSMFTEYKDLKRVFFKLSVGIHTVHKKVSSPL